MATKFALQLRRALTRFRADASGATAVLFAVLAFPVLAFGTAAIDYNNALSTKNSIQDAADAAAAAGAQQLGQLHEVIEGTIRGYLHANLPENRQGVSFVVDYSADDTSLTLKVTDNVPTRILGLVGVKKISIDVQSSAERPHTILVPISQGRPHGSAPELPPEFRTSAGQNRGPTLGELRDAEQQVRQILDELERSGNTADAEQLLRALQGHN